MSSHFSRKRILFLIPCFFLITYFVYSFSKGPTESEANYNSESDVSSISSHSPELKSQGTSTVDSQGKLTGGINIDNSSADSKPMKHKVFDDLKRFSEAYDEAIASQDYTYAGQLLNHKACTNAPRDPEMDPDCLPLLRKKISNETRIFMSDDLANSYLTLESKSDLKIKALESIKSINPDLYSERKPCLEYGASDLPATKNLLIEECLVVLKDLSEEGLWRTFFWSHFEYKMTVSRTSAEQFRSEMEEKFPGISDTTPPPPQY